MDASYQNGLKALAGGSQPGATLIGGSTFTRFTTVASANDSSVLPPAAAGLSYVVKNAGANSMNVFPNGSTDVINALAVQTAFALAAGKTAMFVCFVAGTWDVLLSA
jgi:hypothetical protein